MRAERGVTREARREARRWGAWLVIATLLLQLWVTAGHFHAEDFGYLGGHHAETAVAGGGGGAGWPGRQPGAPAHDDCPLCFSLQLAGSAALPDVAPPAAPGDALALLVLPPQEPRLASAPYLLFRTRAPPTL